MKLVAWFAGKAIDMGKVRLFLQGKKTYLVGLGAIVAAVTAWSGDTMNDTQAIEAIVAALVAMFIRAGVTTEVKNLKK